MTVKELIKRLQKLPQDSIVYIMDQKGGVSKVFFAGHEGRVYWPESTHYHGRVVEADGWEEYAYDLGIEDDEEAKRQFDNLRWVDITMIEGDW